MKTVETLVALVIAATACGKQQTPLPQPSPALDGVDADLAADDAQSALDAVETAAQLPDADVPEDASANFDNTPDAGTETTETADSGADAASDADTGATDTSAELPDAPLEPDSGDVQPAQLADSDLGVAKDSETTDTDANLPVAASPCDDGYVPPKPGSLCTAVGATTCSRTGETAYPLGEVMPVKWLCRRPNHFVCTKTSSGLTWLEAPCGKLDPACSTNGNFSTCQQLGEFGACCPLVILGGNLFTASMCTPASKGVVSCLNSGYEPFSFGVHECGVFGQVSAEWMKNPGLADAAGKALAECQTPASKQCLYFWVKEICPGINLGTCNPPGDTKIYDPVTVCLTNVPGKPLTCAKTCDDLKKYTKLVKAK